MPHSCFNSSLMMRAQIEMRDNLYKEHAKVRLRKGVLVCRFKNLSDEGDFPYIICSAQRCGHIHEIHTRGGLAAI